MYYLIGSLRGGLILTKFFYGITLKIFFRKTRPDKVIYFKSAGITALSLISISFITGMDNNSKFIYFICAMVWPVIDSYRMPKQV